MSTVNIICIIEFTYQNGSHCGKDNKMLWYNVPRALRTRDEYILLTNKLKIYIVNTRFYRNNLEATGIIKYSRY